MITLLITKELMLPVTETRGSCFPFSLAQPRARASDFNAVLTESKNQSTTQGRQQARASLQLHI
jgi:hypothetical protein